MYKYIFILIINIFLNIEILIYIKTFKLKYMGCLDKCLRWFKVHDSLSSKVWIYPNLLCILRGLKKTGQHFSLPGTRFKLKPAT